MLVLANIKVDGKSSDRVVEAPKSIISAIDISELRSDGIPKEVHDYKTILDDMAINNVRIKNFIDQDKMAEKKFIKVRMNEKVVGEHKISPIIYASINFSPEGVMKDIDSIMGAYLETDAESLSGKITLIWESNRSVFIGAFGEIGKNTITKYVTSILQEEDNSVYTEIISDRKHFEFESTFSIDDRFYVQENY